jgi:hypothetical protein
MQTTNLITATVTQFRQLSGLGNTRVYELIAAGELATVAVGKRRLVIIASYHAMLERLLAAETADCRRNVTVPPLGSRRRGRPRKVAS